MLLTLTSCVTTYATKGQDNTIDKELGQTSYIPYQYVHTNPPDKLLPPPTFIHSEAGEYTYYNENELEAYADSLVEYHSYLERYIGSMEGSDGKTLISVGGERCMMELESITPIAAPPRRPIPPNYSSVEKAEGTGLMVKYLGEVDRWIEDLEKHHAESVKKFNGKIARLKVACAK